MTGLRSQGRNEEGQGEHDFPSLESLGGAEWLRGTPKNPNNVTQYSTFASERPQVRICGRQTCFLARAPFNLVVPLDAVESISKFLIGNWFHVCVCTLSPEMWSLQVKAYEWIAEELKHEQRKHLCQSMQTLH